MIWFQYTIELLIDFTYNHSLAINVKDIYTLYLIYAVLTNLRGTLSNNKTRVYMIVMFSSIKSIL